MNKENKEKINEEVLIEHAENMGIEIVYFEGVRVGFKVNGKEYRYLGLAKKELKKLISHEEYMKRCLK